MEHLKIIFYFLVYEVIHNESVVTDKKIRPRDFVKF